MPINARQLRPVKPAADAVARGLNILAARNAELVSRTMRHKHVPEKVIARLVRHLSLRRRNSAGQEVSKAIASSSAADQSPAVVATDQTQAESDR